MKQVLIAIDQLTNACLGGWADETLSARAWRWQAEGRRTWPRQLLDALFFFDPDHCENSWRSEILRTHLPKAYRQ